MGRELASPGGAWSSHSAMRVQTSMPEVRNWLPTGAERRAATTEGPQAQPARIIVSARASASSRLGCGLAANSLSNCVQAARSASACACAPFGSG